MANLTVADPTVVAGFFQILLLYCLLLKDFEPFNAFIFSNEETIQDTIHIDAWGYLPFC